MSDGCKDTEIEVERNFAAWGTRRRKLLSAMGTAAIAAIAGCGQNTGEQTRTGTPEDTMTTAQQTTEEPDEQDQGGDGDGIDPRFGYTATSPDEEPPVEPDHTVDLQIQPVEGREIPEFYFEPTGLAIEPGDTVKFNMATPHHNVVAHHPAFGYTQRVPDDVPQFSSPMLTAGEYWLYTFEQEGVHDFNCAPHELFGMVGRVVVGSATGPGANPVGEAPAPSAQSRPPEFTAGLVLGDDAMAPDNILEQGSVSWADIADENKRLLLGPLEEEGGSGAEEGQ